jgi:signal transduction histidine kinase
MLFYLFYRYRIGQIILLQRIRNKIAADLHDDIGSTLNSISVFSEVARRDDSKKDRALAMIGESSRKIIESMSDIVWSINPENDSFDKIIFRMRSLSYNLLKIKTIECTFNADESLSGIKLPMEIRRNFYLIFKEALNNLVKYSQAFHASILVSREHSTISCIVRDDGIGFDNSREYEGNGLGNMRKRAKEIGAVLVIKSAIGKGTTIELNLRI